MRILSIETSCDESAISIIEARGGLKKTKFKILANNVASQINIHKEYGGVFPMVAKREHSKNLIPLLKKTFKESDQLIRANRRIVWNAKIEKKVIKILEREPDLLKEFLKFIPKIDKPKIDTIAVTHGPGLEPALWVGVNLARALAAVWGIPIIPVNHMEGHFLSVFANGKEFSISNFQPARKTRSGGFPMLALLVSGGHTELILSKDWLKYEKIGETRDDAAGEAFDKVARLLGLPYPGGPEISKLAEKEREDMRLRSLGSATARARGIFQQKNIRAEQAHSSSDIKLPRPMLNSPDFDFSFSGLKTAVLYLTQKIGKLTPKIKREIAREFEDAAIEVLVSKTLRAAEKYKVKTLIVAGGVASNKHLRQVFTYKLRTTNYKLLFPTRDLATDNSLMIAIAGYFQTFKKKKTSSKKLRAQGNLQI